MISKDTYRFVMNRIETSSNAQLLVIKDELRELLRHPISVDKELVTDTKKLLKKIDQEIDARYDLYLIAKHRAPKQQQPASASVVPLHSRYRSDV